MSASIVAREAIGLGNAARRRRTGRQAHATQVDEGESMLLVATVLEGTHASIAPASTSAETIVNTAEVHLQEDKLFVQLGDKWDSEHACWILFTSATNHMTGSRSSFTDLKKAICGTEHFGDGSVVGIEGKGTVMMECKNGEHCKLARVYHIPKLKALICFGQLDEDGYGILIDRGVLRV
jgi:hypothetical protein